MFGLSIKEKIKQKKILFGLDSLLIKLLIEYRVQCIFFSPWFELISHKGFMAYEVGISKLGQFDCRSGCLDL